MPLLLKSAAAICALLLGVHGVPHSQRSEPCEHAATSRECWGDYNVDTDYSKIFPDTGIVREVRNRSFKQLTGDLDTDKF
jgi:hypothetical protein